MLVSENGFFIYFYLYKIFATIPLEKKGIVLGKNITWLGLPIITLHSGSSINIGNDCLICSISNQTALGIAHPVILRTLNSKAKLFVENDVRMSGTSICSANSIIIGNRCVIGADVIISDTDSHSLNPVIRLSVKDSQNALMGSVHIGDDVFIGGVQ